MSSARHSYFLLIIINNSPVRDAFRVPAMGFDEGIATGTPAEAEYDS